MEIRDLKYFVKLCEMRSFSKAADDLYITQPTLSKSVKRLEKELDTPILDHSMTHFKLTEIGQKMYKKAKRIIDDFEQMTDELSMQKQSREVIRIGTLPQHGPKELSMLIIEFEKSHPNVDIELSEGPLGEFFEPLVKKQIDFIYANWPLNIKFFKAEEMEFLISTEFTFHQLYEMELYFAVNKNNTLIMKKNLSMEDLKDQKIIVFNEAIKKGYTTYYNSLGIHNVKFLIVPDTDDMHRLVGQDEGVALLHEDLIRASKNVVHIKNAAMGQGLLELKHASTSYAKRQFIDMLQNKFAVKQRAVYVS